MSWDALSTIYYHHKVEIHYIPKQQKEREEKKEKQKEKKRFKLKSSFHTQKFFKKKSPFPLAPSYMFKVKGKL